MRYILQFEIEAANEPELRDIAYDLKKAIVRQRPQVKVLGGPTIIAKTVPSCTQT